MASSPSFDFNVLDFFKAEVQNPRAAVKTSAVDKLNLIAYALGPQRTVSELIPFTVKSVQEEPWCNDEELLFKIAKQYAVLADYTNGQYDMLIPPLEHLAAQEETVIRDQAVQSLVQIAEKKPALAEHLVPMLHRLASKSDFFAARVSACALFAATYRYAGEEQKGGLRRAYCALCTDDTPMVRRAAAQRMQDLFAVCDKQDILSDLIGMYRQLSQDHIQDTIRVACVRTSLVLAGMCNADENTQHTVSVVKDAAEDRSWRVRLAVVKNVDQFCSAFGPEITSLHLLPAFVSLLKDTEQEVRREAVRVIEPCLRAGTLTSEQLTQHILPQLQSLAIDPSQAVRAALAQILGPVATALGREATQKTLLPLASELMRDEFHDVRLNIVSHAGVICEVLGADSQTHALLSTVQSLIMDNHWRIRQSVVEQVPKLAKLFGPEMFQSKLEALVLSSLRDSVHAVRQATIVHLKEISDSFGAQWTCDHLLPKIKEHYSLSSGYTNRITTLHGLPQVSHAMTPEQVATNVIPLLIKATKDSVPNVRFCACRMIAAMLEHHNLSAVCVNTAILPALKELEHDQDVDVQYFAARARALS